MTMFRLALLVAVVAATCPPGYLYYGGTNKCFLFVNDTLKTWSQAQAACVASGGNLASIANEEEDQFVANIFSNFPNIDKFPWIGLTRPTPDAQTPKTANWYWVDGSNSTYRKFENEYFYQNATYVMLEFDEVDWTTTWTPLYRQTYLCSATPTLSANCSSRPNCETGWTYYDESHSCFKTFFNQDFWGAEQVCQQNGGHLASVASDMENYFVGNLAQTGIRQSLTRQVWLGITKVNGSWVNVDGTKCDEYNFGPGFPDNQGGNENCVEIFSDDWDQKNGYKNTWNDIDCQVGLRAFVCKKKAFV